MTTTFRRRSVLLALTALGACATHDGVAPPDGVAPSDDTDVACPDRAATERVLDAFRVTALAGAPIPPELELVGVPVAGRDVVVQVDGGPQRRVLLLWGPGPAAAGPCPEALGGACLDVACPTSLRTVSFVSGDDGRVVVTLPPSGSVVFQAVDATTGGGLALTSAPLGVTPLDAAADEDDDGLSNGDEVDRGTQVLQPDSDADGRSDGDEVAHGLDPLDPSDASAPGCPGAPPCELLCADRHDDDGDQRIDCFDPDCAARPACAAETVCQDGFDDDADGDVDCDDDDCAGRCDQHVGGEADCGNGVDDDRDGLVDCEDVACAESSDCVELDCTDGLDGDDDGEVDCDDDDCWSAACHVAVLTWPVDGSLRSVRGYGGPTPSHAVVGRAYVASSQGGTTSCSWTSTGVTTAHRWVDPRCRLGDGAFPALTTSTVGHLAARTTGGASWFGPAAAHQGGHVVTGYAAGSRYTFQVISWTSFHVDVGPVDPVGTCDGPDPQRWLDDEDGDGAGVPDTRDDLGRAPGTRWRCSPGDDLGLVTDATDCDDLDPAVGPGDVPADECDTLDPLEVAP